MKELFEYLKTLPPGLSIIGVILVPLGLIVFKWNVVEKIMKLFSKNKRTCGDCVLILFGIREKYEYHTRKLNHDLLKKQMTFAEQKLQEIVFFLAQSFNEDIKVLGDGMENSQKLKESALYCEALKNSLISVKDEIRRSFKENGFIELSDTEFSQYIKNKVTSMLMISRTYLKQHYIETDDTIVTLDHRFKKMDSYHRGKVEDITFQVFNKAKDLSRAAKVKRKDLDNSFTGEIDAFINGNPASKKQTC